MTQAQPTGPVQVRTYREATAEASALRFQADASKAAESGYYPTSQVWEGSALTVTYQRRETQATPSEPAAAARPSSIVIPSVAVVIGGALIALGSVMPWVRAGIVSASGMEGDGVLTLIAGVALILLGIAGVMDAERASRLSLVAFLVALLAIVVACLDIIDITNRIWPEGEVAAGLPVVVIGGFAALGGAIMARVRRVGVRGLVAVPDVSGDFRALPQEFRRPLVWLPFGLLALTFVLSVALINGALDELPDPVNQGISLYISLTLHPTSLFIFFIGGFLARRGSYIGAARTPTPMSRRRRRRRPLALPSPLVPRPRSSATPAATRAGAPTPATATSSSSRGWRTRTLPASRSMTSRVSRATRD